MASNSLLLALLLLTWFFLAVLILFIAIALFVLKDSYTIKVNLECIPTPLATTPIDEQALNWSNNVVNQVSFPAAATLVVADDHNQLLLLALLGFCLTTLLAVLALALIVPLTLRLTIRHLEREHQWAYNIAVTAQRPLPHTTTTLPIIAANRDSNNPTQVYFEYIREHQD
ncbi:uncharacterized protein FIBRA_09082 [Fibroporia radiculosa]|uniref:Uncharacterized protein n=1 Tax=Fibroporia radiculosa TaxID=599839 RepID=J4GIU9_9APHY|nr:uncharacterized protein FIBRA_09082 [Fibroporia radiculosa]CCM06783.1 predicted protein [Fibroporia radiculosa]